MKAGMNKVKYCFNCGEKIVTTLGEPGECPHCDVVYWWEYFEEDEAFEECDDCFICFEQMKFLDDRTRWYRNNNG